MADAPTRCASKHRRRVDAADAERDRPAPREHRTPVVVVALNVYSLPRIVCSRVRPRDRLPYARASSARCSLLLQRRQWTSDAKGIGATGWDGALVSDLQP